MKLIVVICLTIQLINCNVTSTKIVDFIQWKQKFNKTYDNTTKTQQALKTYQLTTKKIENHNKKFKLGTETFRQTPNMFADLPPVQLKNIAKGFRPPVFEMSGRSANIITSNSLKPAPDSMDWRAKGIVTPVKDQGFFCNSCWAFSAISAIETYYSLKFGKNVSFSEQQLIDCNANNVTGNYGCNGGNQGAAFSYMTFTGIESVETYPYEEDLPHESVYPCRSNSSNGILTIKGFYRMRPKDEETMKRFIFWIGPLVGAFCGSQPSYMYYRDGIYDDPECSSCLSHSTLIVGYGVAKGVNGTLIPYWLCKNSWSTEWGEEGFFRIIRGKNMCGLTSYLIAPILG